MAIVRKEGHPVGYRFHPTDKELVDWYLKRKNQGQHDDDVSKIAVVDLCKFEPWDLPGMIRSDDPVGYFFSPRDYKYGNSKMLNRRTRAGFWKSTGNPRKILYKGRQIGWKRTLVFHTGRQPKGIRTGWVIHQYDVYAPDLNLQDQGKFILCKLKKKPNEKTREGKPSHHIVLASDSENQNPTEMATNSFRDEHQPAPHMAYDAENQCPVDATAASTDANGDTSRSMAPDENQISAVTPAFEYQLPSTGDDFSISSLENLATFREEGCPPMVISTDSSQSSNEKCDWLSVSDFKNQISACGEVIIPHTTMYFDLEKGSPSWKGDGLTTSYTKQIAPSGEGEFPPLVISSELRSGLPPEKGDCLSTSESTYTKGDGLMTSPYTKQISTRGEGELPPLVISSKFRSGLPCKKGDSLSTSESTYSEGDGVMTSPYTGLISACGEGECPPSVISSESRSGLPCEKGVCLSTSDLKSQLLDNVFKEGAWNPPVRAPSEDCLNTSYLGNQTSHVDSEEGQETSHILVPSMLGDQPTLNKGGPNTLLSYAFRNINSDDKINISVSEEGESSSLKMMPSDIARQNLFQKTDMQNLEDFDRYFQMAFDEETANAELYSELMRILAAGLQYTLNSDLEGVMFADGISCDSGLYH